MLLDGQNLVSTDQDISQVIGTYVSDKSIDLGVAGTIPGLGGTVLKDIGRGVPKRFLCQITETVTSGGAATIQAQIIESATEDLASPTVLASSEVIALAKLVAGYQFQIPFIPHGVTKRFLGAQYVIGTATTTAGKVTAGFAMEVQQNPSV